MKDENYNSGAMAEWSKAIDLSSIIFGCAGSNPAGTNNLRYLTAIILYNKNVVSLYDGFNNHMVSVNNTQTKDTMAEWLRRWT